MKQRNIQRNSKGNFILKSAGKIEKYGAGTKLCELFKHFKTRIYD
jgi:hypothetical protein